MTEHHALWVERYRPKTVSEAILPSGLRAKFEGVVSSGMIPNLILAGPAGVGKTTIAKALADQLGYDVLFVNGSNEGRILDTLRTMILGFASTVSFSDKRKVVIIDEADQMPIVVQDALRSFIEEFSGNCSFLMTCNHPQKMTAAMVSRHPPIMFDFPAEEQAKLMAAMMKRAKEILSGNNIDFSREALVELLAKFYPDWRRFLGELQMVSLQGSVTLETIKNHRGTKAETLIGFLKSKDFKSARIWIGENPIDPPSLIRSLYDDAREMVEPASLPELILILNKYQYQNHFVPDPELNLAAMCIEIIANVVWKQKLH